MTTGRGNHDHLVLTAINASFKRCIDLDTLLALLRQELSPEKWFCHLGAFFTEVPNSDIIRFLLDHQIDFSRVAEIHDSLPAAMQNASLREVLV